MIYAWHWVHKAAHILGNEDGASARVVQRRFDGLLGAMSRHGHHAGTLAPALERFAHVARRWHAGLFHCYDNAELPRTNNALEQLFGSYRYHERRTTGRKAASPATVLRGAVRLLAATATRGGLDHGTRACMCQPHPLEGVTGTTGVASQYPRAAHAISPQS